MKRVVINLVLLAMITALAGYQRPSLAQVHLQQIWEYGRPIDASFVGYTKGVWIQQYKQYVFFDQGVYRCRSTTLVRQGFSSELTTGEIKGKWRPGMDGVPRLEQPDGSYLAINLIHPTPEESPYDHLPPQVHLLRQTYNAQLPKPFALPVDRQPVDLYEEPDPPAEPEPEPEAADPAESLPITPFQP